MKRIDSQKLLKNCYEKGAAIEYFDGDKWNVLPPGLPLDFSQFAEGKIRLKFNDPTYEQVMEFKAKYGEPMVTEWDLENIPMLAFCHNHDFCSIVTVKNNIKMLRWDPTSIWRFYGKKEYLPETSQKELEEIFKKRAEENSEEYGDPEHWDKCYIETKGGESNSTADMINAINESLNCLPNNYDISQVKSILKKMLKLIIKVGSK